MDDDDNNTCQLPEPIMLTRSLLIVVDNMRLVERRKKDLVGCVMRYL